MIQQYPSKMENSSTQSRFIGIDALFQYVGSGVQLFSGMVFYIIAVRLFDTSEVGAIALFVGVVGLFNMLFSFGLSAAAQHFTSYNIGRGDYASAKRTIYKILSFSIILSVIGLISLQLLAGEISEIFLHSAGYSVLVRLLGIVLFGNILFGVLNGTILGIQQFRLSAIINIVIWITYYFGAVFFAIYLRAIDTIIFGWALGILLGVAIELIVVLSSIKKYFYSGLGVSTSTSFILSYSIPVLLSGLISYGAAYADRFIVSGLLSLSALGIYNFSLLIASAISFLTIPFNNILLPKLSELFGKSEKVTIARTAEVSATLLSYFYVPSALGIAALAPIILHLLGGDTYVAATNPLRIIMLFTALFITQSIFTQVIASIRKTKLLLYSSLLALSGNAILSMGLISPLGLDGAAIGYSSVYVITFFVLYYYAKRESLFSLDTVGITKIWISASVMFLTIDILSKYSGNNFLILPVYIILGSLIYLGLANILDIFKKDSVDLILSLFPDNHALIRKAVLFIVLHRKTIEGM